MKRGKMTKEFRCNRAFGGEPDRDYAAALSVCESADDVRALVAAYRELAVDAESQAVAMTDADSAAFKAGLKKGNYILDSLDILR